MSRGCLSVGRLLHKRSSLAVAALVLSCSATGFSSGALHFHGVERHDLQRFIAAQNQDYETVLEELRLGEKRSHWMWFIFPQMRGLGRSPTATHFGIASLDEAHAYLEHPILGPRLRECTDLVLQVKGKSAQQIFGSIDKSKLKSSMTLFERAEGGGRFGECLTQFFGGERDAATLELVGVDQEL